jgi:hypothetical protein
MTMISRDIWPLIQSNYDSSCCSGINDIDNQLKLPDIVTTIINNGYNIATLSSIFRDFDFVRVTLYDSIYLLRYVILTHIM